MLAQEKILAAKILIVDDQKIHVLFLEKILRGAGYVNIYSTTDPRGVVSLYQSYLPDLILLDLKMPNVDGFQIMEQLKDIRKDSYLPILVLSEEKSQDVRLRALEAGAADIIPKPYDDIEVLVRIRNIIQINILNDEVRNQNKILELKVQDRTKELRETQSDIIRRLARAAEYRDTDTGKHILRMSHYSVKLGVAAGLSADQCDLLLTSSPLHDIGKIAIPDNILLKPGKLTPEEWEVMKTHTTTGARLLSGSDSGLMKMAEVIALTHHEKWDGTGYPQGMKGEDIPLVGRICGLCDVFDALTTKRPYKEAWTSEAALDEIRNGRGTHFDPHLVDCFVNIFPEILAIKHNFSE